MKKAIVTTLIGLGLVSACKIQNFSFNKQNKQKETCFNFTTKNIEEQGGKKIIEKLTGFDVKYYKSENGKLIIVMIDPQSKKRIVYDCKDKKNQLCCHTYIFRVK